MGLHLMSMRLIGMDLVGLDLMSVYLMGVYLIGVDFIGLVSYGCAFPIRELLITALGKSVVSGLHVAAKMPRRAHSYGGTKRPRNLNKIAEPRSRYYA